MASGTDRVVRRSATVVIGILLAVVSLTSVVLSNPSWRERVRRQMGWQAQFDVGFPSGVPQEWHQSAKPTIVIFVSSSCEACRRSAVFHSGLRAAAAAGGLRVVTALTSPNDDPSAYAATESLPASDVVRFDVTGSRLRIVPTIVIVDHSGMVIDMKEGVLPESEQHALLESLKKLLPL